jgi:hypothetical protein
LSKISLANAVETSILIVGIFTLLVFGGSYYFVLSDVNASEQPLKDALSITASFFGGFATLTAAYIASRLFNDWRAEYNKITESEYLKLALKYIREIQTIERQCRIAIKQSNTTIKYGILGRVKNDVLDSNNNKLVQILLEYCTLLNDNNLKSVVKSYENYTLGYTFILTTIKASIDINNIPASNTLFLDNLLKSGVIINQKNYLYEDIFVGLEETNLQQEILNRIVAK